MINRKSHGKRTTVKTMQRKPEPELMDSPVQTRAYADADFSDSNALFVAQFMEGFHDLDGNGRLVDLGCGPADICIRLTDELPGWQITGLDAGENMLRRAAEAIEHAGKQDGIELRLARLPDTDLEAGSFDVILSNSLLHHLPEPMTLWESVRYLARPGAAVTVMDLRRPDSKERAQELVGMYAQDAPKVLQEDFFNSLLAAYTPDEIQDQLQQAGMLMLSLSLPSDRHWMVRGLLPG